MGKQKTFSIGDGYWIEGTPYRVVRGLGVGGMGEVYEADQTRTGTRRALKVLREACDPRGQSARRMRIEGIALLQLDHPNVVRVFELGCLRDGRPFFTMELLEGMNLRQVMRGAQLPVPRAVWLIVQALDGLQAVHDRGIVHRDIKPSNLFWCRNGTVKLLDFGVAKWLDGSELCPLTQVRTEAGMALGTARYMAPEQLRGRGADSRSDLYAMALVLFELLAGRHPFDDGESPEATVLARLHHPAPSLSQVASRPMDAGLEAVLARALAQEPKERFRTAKAFAAALRQAVAPSLPHGADGSRATTVRISPVSAASAFRPAEPARRPRSAATPAAVTTVGLRPLTAGVLMLSTCALAACLAAVVATLVVQAARFERDPNAPALCAVPQNR